MTSSEQTDPLVGEEEIQYKQGAFQGEQKQFTIYVWSYIITMFFRQN